MMRYKYWLVIILFFSLPVTSFAGEKLIFALDLIRHGDRTPVIAIPAANYEWQEGQGQLTAIGMRQEYLLGRTLRQRYVETEHLLPETYRAGTLYVRSTDYDRTLMSAQSLLMGLYPAGTSPHAEGQGLPHAIQPIPVHSAPVDQDKVILHHLTNEESDVLLKKYLYATPEWKQKEAALIPHYKRWSEATGVTIQSLEDVTYVGDALAIHCLHHLPMPAALTEEDINTIIETNEWLFKIESHTIAIAAAHSRQLMTNIANYLQRGTNTKAPLKFVLLSAHDSTIASVMSLMSVPPANTPPYASDLNFSLYESGSQHYVVKVTYNGTPVSIPACGGTVCPLQKFIEVANGPSV
jgi:lysosomal acid phosphatase